MWPSTLKCVFPPQQPAQALHPRAQLPEPGSLGGCIQASEVPRFRFNRHVAVPQSSLVPSSHGQPARHNTEPTPKRGLAGRLAPQRRLRSRRRSRKCAPRGAPGPGPAPTARADGPGSARRSPWWLNSLQILVKRIPILGPLRPAPAPPHPPPGAARGRGRLRARPGSRPAGGAPRAGPARAAHCGPSASRARTSPPPALLRPAPRAAQQPPRRPPAGTAPLRSTPHSSRPP